MTEHEGALLCGKEDKEKVYMEYGAYLDILRYGKVGSLDGARGVMLGSITDGVISIEKAVPAVYTGDEGLESPSFTKQSWGRITEEINSRYGDLKILGQYATHVDTVTTDDDLLMQQSFFSEKQNLLFIFDPLNNTESMNILDKNEFKKLEGFYLYDKFCGTVDLKQKDSITRSVDKEYEYRKRALNRFDKRLGRYNAVYITVSIILAIMLIYSIFQNFELGRRYNELKERVSAISSEVSANKNDIDNKIKEITATPSPTPTPKAKKTNAR